MVSWLHTRMEQYLRAHVTSLRADPPLLFHTCPSRSSVRGSFRQPAEGFQGKRSTARDSSRLCECPASRTAVLKTCSEIHLLSEFISRRRGQRQPTHPLTLVNWLTQKGKPRCPLFCVRWLFSVLPLIHAPSMLSSRVSRQIDTPTCISNGSSMLLSPCAPYNTRRAPVENPPVASLETIHAVLLRNGTKKAYLGVFWLWFRVSSNLSTRVEKHKTTSL